MENVDIARVLQDIAVLLEIKGSNPFRIRAYQNAARTVEEQTTPLRVMVEDDADLTALPGIGRDIGGYIRELVTTGDLGLYEELTNEVPESLIELTRLPGIGAKKVRRLWDDIGVRTIADLERAAKEGRVADLEGFGAKSQQKILDGIVAYRRRIGRFGLAEAEQYVEPLVAYLAEHEGVERVEVAGSYRRRRETVGDIDVLAVATDPAAVMKHFTAYTEVKRVTLTGDTKTTVHLRSGLQVDLRVVPAASYGAALQYFTGSKEHNVRLRKRAVAQGLSVSEYGVMRLEDGASESMLDGDTEEHVYAALGLSWIPPELREDRGEIDAAAQGTLPDLLTLEDIRGDLQMHSTWSDGKHSIEEMLEACAERGYDYCAITDHSKALAMTGGLDADKLRAQWEEMAEIAERHHDIRLLRGMEVDILRDGTIDLEDELLNDLDLVLVSVHSSLDLPPAQQTERILTAIRHPAVNIFGHPTGRLINRRDAMAFDLDEVLKAAAECRVIVELNAHPDRLDLKDTHLLRARELNLRVAISTDAHRVGDLGLMRYGVEQARRAWLTRADVVNAWELEHLQQVLAKS